MLVVQVRVVTIGVSGQLAPFARGLVHVTRLFIDIQVAEAPGALEVKYKHVMGEYTLFVNTMFNPIWNGLF